MHKRANLVYLYDGSFDGLLCCIFESFKSKQLPFNILKQHESQTLLLTCKNIDTDNCKANRVKKGLKKKSERAYNMIRLAFLSCHPQKEALILDYARLVLKHGEKVLAMLANETVNELCDAVRALTRESHKLKGFVRFSVYNNALVSVIEPKNQVLPLLAPHFCDRYRNETFMIYDKTHQSALIYKSGQAKIIPIDDLTPPQADENELYFRRLWKLFYDTVAIRERYNPKCRMTMMPKRFWGHLTEMDDANDIYGASLAENLKQKQIAAKNNEY